jgi:alanine-synthesizing transaminase
VFSSRIPGHERPNRLSQLLSRKRSQGEEILDLTVSNPTTAGFSYPDLPILTRQDSLYVAEPFGLLSAREAVCRYYEEQHGVAISPEQVILTASTSEAYSFLFKLLCDPGDQVLVPRPSYPLFEHLAQLESVEPVFYPLQYNEGWWIDLQTVRSLAHAQTRAVVVVSPNNPTGSCLKQNELQALDELGLPIIVDEVFSDYRIEPAPSSLRSIAGHDRALSFAISGLSKVCGLPQMKLAWIVVSGPGREHALHKLEVIADAYLSVGTPVQLALPELLASRGSIQDQIRGRTFRNLAVLQSLCKGTVVRVLPHLEAGWYATVQLPSTQTEEEWVVSLLDQQNVLTQPGYFFDFEREPFLVLSLLTPENSFRESVLRLLAHVQSFET